MTGYTFYQLFDFTRTTSATFVGSNGLIQTTPASVNLLTFTQEFDNAAWFKTATTVTANATAAPDGTLTADKLVENTATAQHILARTENVASAPVTFSVYAKAAERSWISLYIGAVNTSAFFNLATGVVGTVQASVTASITSVGNGWYLCSITASSSGSGALTRGIYLANADNSTTYTGDGTSGLFVWGAQLELGSTATTYTRNNGGVYPARFDYDPVTLAPKGILIEEQRTNLLAYSQDWTNAAWAKTNITVTAAATASPDGTTNAQRLQATATAATNVSTAGIAVAATSASFSVYVKQGSSATTANSFAIRNSTTATNLILGTLNYSTGIWTYSTGSTGVTVSNAGNGWWRLQISASTGITSGDVIIAYTGFLGASATAGDHLFAYGAQLEAGAFATSYIPTVASQVTRSADVCSIVAPMFAPWYNQSEGTFVVEASKPSATGFSYVLIANNSTNNERFSIYQSTATAAGFISTGGVTQLEITASPITANVPFKAAVTAGTNSGNFSFNGNIGSTDTSLSMPAPNKFDIGCFGVASQINGHIRSIKYYPFRASNNQLQVLST